MPSRAPAFALLALALGTALPLRAHEVAAGIDLWITPHDDPGTVAEVRLPGDFFDLYSYPIQGQMIFHGQPLVTDPPSSLKPADSILERLETAHLTVCGGPVEVPLQISALHLKAEQMLRVYYQTSRPPEDWSVEVFLSPAAQDAEAAGSLKLWQNCDAGGTLESRVKVRPRFVFTRASDHAQKVLDWQTYPNYARQIELSTTGSWARSVPDGYLRTTAEAGARVDSTGGGHWLTLPGTTGDFVVGMKASPCSCTKSARGNGKSDPATTYEEARLAELAAFNSHLVSPASNSNDALPSHALGNPHAPGRPPTPLRRAFLLLPMGLLVLAAGAAVPRRKPRVPEDGD